MSQNKAADIEFEQPLIANTEIEHNMEIQESLSKLTEKQNINRSIFNISFDSSFLEKGSQKNSDYESRLETEVKSWLKIFKTEIGELKSLRERKQTIDITSLPPEKRAYLKEAPDLQKFLRDSKEFREKAHTYLSFDYAEIKGMQDNLIEICEHRMNLAIQTKILESFEKDPLELL